MTREEYKKKLTEELSGMDREELKAYARENSIRLYTTVPDKMLSTIVQAKTNREFHGDAFRLRSIGSTPMQN